MQEEDALQFYEDVVSGEANASSGSVQHVLEAANGRELTVDLTELDRKYVIDQLNSLPDEMLEMFSEADDPEEAQRKAEEQNALTGLSGGAIESFENLCAESMDHAELTQHHFDDMVKQLSLEVLFEMGSKIIEISLEEDGRITGFRELS